MAQRTRFFFKETNDRDEAFPGIKSINLTVEQDLWGVQSRGGKPTVHRYTKQSIPGHEKCVNPRCKQGGLNLQNIVSFEHLDGKDFYCGGHEGSPQGRRKGTPCTNSFRITLSVEKLDKSADDPA
jgi:hypothetical protein